MPSSIYKSSISHWNELNPKFIASSIINIEVSFCNSISKFFFKLVKYKLFFFHLGKNGTFFGESTLRHDDNSVMGRMDDKLFGYDHGCNNMTI